MDGGSVETLTCLLRDGVDELLTADLSRLPSVDVPVLLGEIETQLRRLAAVDHRLVAELTERGLAGDYAATSTADLLVQLLRITPTEAAARITQAGELGPRRTVTGEPLPPSCRRRPLPCAQARSRPSTCR